MDKLESDINDLMNKMNQHWVKEIEEATKTGQGIDMTKMFGRYSEVVKEKDKSFQDAKIRLVEKGRKKFLGLI